MNKRFLIEQLLRENDERAPDDASGASWLQQWSVMVLAAWVAESAGEMEMCALPERLRGICSALNPGHLPSSFQGGVCAEPEHLSSICSE